MPWLKKNLVLVVAGAVALVLLGLAGYFLYSKYSLESQVTEELAAQTKELNDLANLDPNPGNEKVDNIKAAQEQEKLLQAFVDDARKTFVPIEYPTNLDSGHLKLLLDDTIDDLQRGAQRAGVKLQSQYAFTFAAQKPLMSFEQNTLQPLAYMLTDIKVISQVLFNARVLALDGIRRVAVTSQDTPSATPGMSDYWKQKIITNDLAVLTPYEFTFHCFTGELATVLEELYRSPHCFLVKNVVVDPSVSQLLEKPDVGASDVSPMMAYPSMNLMQMQMMMRYGMRSRYAPAPQPEAPAQVPTARGGLTPMLDEKPFRVVLWVNTIRMRSPEEIKAARASRPARTARPAVSADGQPAESPDAQATPAPDATQPAEGGGAGN